MNDFLFKILSDVVGAGLGAFVVNLIFQKLRYSPLKKMVEYNSFRIDNIYQTLQNQLDNLHEKIATAIGSVKTDLEKDIERLNLSNTYLTDTQKEEFNAMLESQKMKIERLTNLEQEVRNMQKQRVDGVKKINDLILLGKYNEQEVKKMEGMIEEIKTLLESRII